MSLGAAELVLEIAAAHILPTLAVEVGRFAFSRTATRSRTSRPAGSPPYAPEQIVMPKRRARHLRLVNRFDAPKAVRVISNTPGQGPVAGQRIAGFRAGSGGCDFLHPPNIGCDTSQRQPTDRDSADCVRSGRDFAGGLARIRRPLQRVLVPPPGPTWSRRARTDCPPGEPRVCASPMFSRVPRRTPRSGWPLARARLTQTSGQWRWSPCGSGWRRCDSGHEQWGSQSASYSAHRLRLSDASAVRNTPDTPHFTPMPVA